MDRKKKKTFLWLLFEAPRNTMHKNIFRVCVREHSRGKRKKEKKDLCPFTSSLFENVGQPQSTSLKWAKCSHLFPFYYNIPQEKTFSFCLFFLPKTDKRHLKNNGRDLSVPVNCGCRSLKIKGKEHVYTYTFSIYFILANSYDFHL